MSDLPHDRAAVSAPPDFLTVDEAGEVLRIGRTAAYRLARQYLATDGAAGIPVVRYGKQFRVPRYKLEDALGGPITWPLHRPESAAPPTPAASLKPGPPRSRVVRRRSSAAEQSPRLFSV